MKIIKYCALVDPSVRLHDLRSTENVLQKRAKIKLIKPKEQNSA